MNRNIYLPCLASIDDIILEAPGVKTFRLKFKNESDGHKFSFRAGQFAEYSVFGEGESSFCIASPHTRKEYIECTFRQVGRVTAALASLEKGAIIGLRGPYGNSFPIEKWKKKNLLFIAGGIALPPIRSVILSCLDDRGAYGNISVFYGAKTIGDFVYKHELKEWGNRKDIQLHLTVDNQPGKENPQLKGNIGSVLSIVKKVAPSPYNTIAIVCGPPLMIKNTFQVLRQLGFSDHHIFTTIENRMKCGFGKCGRCNVGNIYICKNGPIFTASQLNTLPNEY